MAFPKAAPVRSTYGYFDKLQNRPNREMENGKLDAFPTTTFDDRNNNAQRMAHKSKTHFCFKTSNAFSFVSDHFPRYFRARKTGICYVISTLLL